MVGKSLPSSTFGRRGRPAAAAGRAGTAPRPSKKSVNTIVVSRRTRSLVSARVRNSAYSGAPMCATTAVSRGSRVSTRREGAGPGELVADRAGAGVDHDRCPGVLEHAPDRVEQRVVEVELRHLDVHLEHLDALARAACRRTPGPRARGRTSPTTGTRAPRGRSRRPVVEVRRDPRPVGVGQRREPAYAEARAAGRPAPRGCRGSGSATPARSSARPGRTGRRPCAGRSRRQEVDVHVEEPGRPRSCQNDADLLDRLVGRRLTPCP